MRFLFRADASPDIGIGHLMRCVALAQELQDHGHSVKFVSCCPASLAERIHREGFSLERIESCSLDPELVARVAESEQVDWIVLDGYEFGREFQSRVRGIAARGLASLDDFASSHYVSDLVINQNIGADRRFRFSVEPHTRILAGERYVMLRREFRQSRISRSRPGGTKLLVTMGGADPENCLSEVLRSVKHDGFQIRAVLGPSYRHETALMADLGPTDAIEIERAPESLRASIEWCDIAISAAGSTVWELAICGRPMILGYYAENQRAIGEELAARGAAICVGRFGSGAPVAEALRTLCSDDALWERCVTRASTVCDGGGVVRIREVFEQW